MSLLFHKSFVDAATGANGFDSVTAANGTVTHSAEAGLKGTSGGVTCARTSNSPNAYGTVTQDFTGKTIYRAAFYVDLSALTIGTDNHNCRLASFVSADGTAIAGMLRPVQLSGVRSLWHYIYRDNDTFAFNTIVLGNPAWVEWRMTAGVGNGASQLYFGGGDYAALGELVSEITGIANATRFQQNTHHLGMRLGSASVAGSIVVDEWTMRDDDTPILFGVSGSRLRMPLDLGIYPRCS